MEAPERLDDTALANLARQWVLRFTPGQRMLLGIAGIPGSGKSTLAQRLCEAVRAISPGCAVVLPMDGFHYRNDELQRMGLRQRKGAPPTFDVQAYVALLEQARDAARTVHFPIYDRALHEPVLRDVPEQRIDPNVRLVITEGNYLLLDQEPWTRLADLLDECWWLHTDADRARQWIIARHVRGGRSPQDAQRHFEQSDQLNVDLVLGCQRKADRTFTWGTLT